ncbi:MAG: xanthine dehydrogenase accessory protein XdhC [Betaproteobacteria bacterium]|nr:xanthine dehydrogenase accessory protein XdhC [Betaproteobacteria bacterium]
MSHWVQELQRLRGEGTPAVLVTVASIKGSAPREPGAKMVVTPSGIFGTIGGGHLELKAIEVGRDMLASGGGSALRRFPLGASLGQCCGGLVNLLFEPVTAGAEWLDTIAALRRDRTECVVVSAAHGEANAGKLVVTSGCVIGTLGAAALDARAQELARAMLGNGHGPWLRQLGDAYIETLLFFEPMRAPDFHIVLFGAGHVGGALVHVLAGLPCRITWVDSREDQFPREIQENVAVACTDTPEAEVDAAPPGSFFLVMTHSHALDQELSERILRRTDFAYFGLIGSLSKRRQFERRMESRGVPPARFKNMTCPIGVPGISGKQPGAIAIAVAAELLQVRDRHSVRMNEPSKAHRA